MSSLKCWLRKVNKQDKISKEDLAEILNLLDGHDKAIRIDERRKFAKWLHENYQVLDNHNEEVEVTDLIWEYEIQ